MGRSSGQSSTPFRMRLQLEQLEDRVTPSTLPTGFTETPIANGLNAPTAMELAPDGRFFVTEQGGAIRVISNGSLLSTPFATVNVDSSGERGLLGITLDPAFSSNGFVYIYYTVPGSPAHNRISRFTASGNVATAGSELVLFELDPLSGATNHNGGGLHFGGDGKLYVGVGENANGANAQSLSNALGKILRLNPDGSIPEDNPYVRTGTGRGRAIWALGLRNPYTFAVQPGTGRVFINDVGASSFEEINDGDATVNFGWPTTEGPTTNPSFRSPIFSYQHGSGNDKGIAISGGVFYNPATAQFPSDYVGDYFFADFGNQWIRRFDPATGTAELFASNTPAGLVDLRVNPAGSLFYLARGTGSNTGTLVRVDSNGTGSGTGQEQTFVRNLYTDLLGRAASTADVNFWVGQLSLQGAAGVSAGIVSSHEYHVRLVREFYTHFLNRAADQTGESFWSGLLDQGQSAELIINGILGSDEFAARATALHWKGPGMPTQTMFGPPIGCCSHELEAMLRRRMWTSGSPFFLRQAGLAWCWASWGAVSSVPM